MIHATDLAEIRVLIDHHHDTGWRDVRRSLGGGPLQVTICRESLRWSVLRRYHVAVTDASAPAQVSTNERKAVERFVKEGGGLLIAGSAPAFSFATAKAVTAMPAARLAEPFGFRFLEPSQCAGDARWDRDFRLGYGEESVEVVGSPVGGLGPQPPGTSTWAPIEAPEDAQPLLVHSETGETLAAMVEHGGGRVVVCGTSLNHFDLLGHLHPLIAWLAGEVRERPGEDVPTEIGALPKRQDIRGLRLICDEPVAERADDLARMIRRFEEFASDIMGRHWRMPETLEVMQACERPRPWDDGLFLAPTGSDAAVTYNVAISLGLDALWNSHAGHVLVTLFPEATLARHIAIRFLEQEGFDEMAAQLREIAREQIDAADPTRAEADLARVYWATEQWQPKGMHLIAELERRYGDDFLCRVFEAIPAKQENDRLPRTFAWDSDRAAWYLSLAAGEDLCPWLREIGTTLHPLPPVAPDDDGFEDAMRNALVDELLARADVSDATRQMEALTDLMRLKTDERAKLPDEVRVKVEAFEASVASDARAIESLSDFAQEDDASTAAWAALQMLSAGEESAADRLIELLPDRDLRFRLMAGHALRKVGREVHEASLEGLNEDGRRVGELDVAHRDFVVIHPKVDGYEVANVIAQSGLAVFPQRTFATRYYIDWVHTSPQWRRSGLSRLAFGAAMDHEEALRCSCFALNTGTRNTAHALYADFGYVDMDRRERAVKQLCAGTPCLPPDGVVIRPIEDDDRETVRRFLLSYHQDAFTISPLPVPMLGARTFITLAERDGELIGVAVASHHKDEEARLLDVAVEGDDDEVRAGIGVALLARLHGLLAGDGARRVTARICSDHDVFTDVLCRAGYARRPSGSVNMFGIRDLEALFEEILPLYEHRLQDGPFDRWRGRVILLGERLRAGLEIEDGEAQVIAADPRPRDVVLRSDDVTLTRVVTGRETPLEGYLQRVSDVEPQVSPIVMKLLETLFPEVPFVVRWGW